MIQVQDIGPLRVLFGRHPAYPYCNTVRVRGRRTLLADPSCEEKALRALAAGEAVDILFNSHYHSDHMRFNRFFPGAEFWAPRGDAPCFRSLETLAEWVGVKGTPYEKSWKAALDQFFSFQEREDLREVEDGELLDLGGVVLQFLHLPGHTPGLTGFWIPEERTLFLADMELSPAGPWYHNRRADIQGIIDSVEKIRKLRPSISIPSHGREVFRGDLGPRLDRYLENIDSREKRILEALRDPQTLDQLAARSPVSRFRLTPDQVWFLYEKNMVEKHLERLLARGEISRVGNTYRRET